MGEAIVIKLKHLVVISALFGAVALTGFDGNQYWHDVRFTYGAAKFGIEELADGKFNPDQLGGEIDEPASGGFYIAKILHIILIKGIFLLVPPHEGGFVVCAWALIGVFYLTVLGSYVFYQHMLHDDRLALFSTICLVLAPISGYLAGKVLAETLSLFLLTGGLTLVVIGLDKTGRRWAIWALFGGILLLGATLARVDILISVVGFLLALLLVGNAEQRARLLIMLTVGAASWLVAYAFFVSLFGGGIEKLAAYFLSFVQSERKNVLMSIVGVLTFGGIVYILGLVGAFHTEKRRWGIFAIWFGISAGISIAITQNFMVEPRYLVPGLLALGGCGGFGVAYVLNRIKFRILRLGVTIVGLGVVLVINWVVYGIMPYELNRFSITKAVAMINGHASDPAILIPWSYTDFHFLSMVRPDLDLYNVNSLIKEERRVEVGREWKKRLVGWYGDRYLSNDNQIDELLDKQDVFYLGWGKYPPLDKAMSLAKRIGMTGIAGTLARLPMKNHLGESWLWHSSHYELSLVGETGQYRYYRVKARERK